jgi:hypothetical protein
VYSGEATLDELFLQRILRRGLSMDEDDIAQWTTFTHALREIQQLRSIRVGAEAVHHDYLGTERPLDTKNANPWTALDDATPERVLRLEANDQHGVLRVFHRGSQVVQHTAGFAHSTGSDHDARLARAVDLLRILARGGVAEARKVEW